MDDRLSHEHDDDGVSRRDFAVLSVATGLAVGAVTSANAADAAVVETDVMVKTPDGMCDAAYFHPATGVHPGVFVWCDAFGLRAATRGIGRRLASAGYSVLVPNPYYRVQKAPVVEDASKFDFNNPTDRNKLQPLMGALSAPGAAERDTVAYVAFLDAQKEVDKSKKIGVQGYCMGGPLMMRAASASERIGAGAAFHGGNNLVTDKPDSPHLLASKIKGRLYFAVAGSDDMRAPDVKDKLRTALADAHVQAEVELYATTIHGWCMPDMPMQDGHPIYNQAEADKAWTKLLALYKAALA